METEKLSQSLASLVSDKCEKCGIRVKQVGRLITNHATLEKERETSKYCTRCLEVLKRVETRSAMLILKLLRDLVEDKYMVAELSHIPEEYRKVIMNLAPDDDLFLYGGVGIGKTYAMAALIKDYLCKGFDVERINFDNFCCRVRSTFNKTSKITENDLITKMTDVDKLFIDDLGLRREEETSFVYATLYSIFNKRQERGLPTLITTNKNIAELASSFDIRIASRLASAISIEMIGDDRRKLKQKGGER